MQSLFVSCPFQGNYAELIDHIEHAASRFSMRALSVDRSSSLAGSIPDEIRQHVRESRLVLADITGKNGNVLNEVGLAQAYGKPLILISRDDPAEAPFNIRHLRILRYSPTDLRARLNRVSEARCRRCYSQMKRSVQ